MTRSLMRDQGGVAVYFVKAVVAVIIAGMVWYLGNIILFGDVGVATTVENLQPGYFGNTDAALKWFWGIFPFVILIGAALYVVYSALIREPTAH